jgi:hypothetical protein
MHYTAGSRIQVSSLEILMIPVVTGTCEIGYRLYYAGEMIIVHDGDVIAAVTDISLGLVSSSEGSGRSTVNEVLLVAEQ